MIYMYFMQCDQGDDCLLWHLVFSIKDSQVNTYEYLSFIIFIGDYM